MLMIFVNNIESIQYWGLLIKNFNKLEINNGDVNNDELC